MQSLCLIQAFAFVFGGFLSLKAMGGIVLDKIRELLGHEGEDV